MGAATRRSLLRAALLVFLPALACGDDPVGPQPVADLRIEPATVVLGLEREGAFVVRNEGTRPVGPILLESAGVSGPGGGRILDARIEVDPDDLPTLNAGASATIRVSVELPTPLPPATYSAAVRIVTDGGEGELPVRMTVRNAAVEEVETVRIVDPPTETLRGRVSPLRVEARDADGTILEAAPLQFSTVPEGAGFFDGSRFVPYETGPVRVVVRGGEAADSATLDVRPRGGARTITVETTAPVSDRATSDLWVHGNHAYTGTWLSRQGAESPGNALFAWDVSGPAAPQLVDSVVVDARVVNDVKVSADGSLGVLTHEFSNDGLNGVTFLDLSDPGHPEIVGRYTDGLESGIHNVWLEGDYAYLVVDGRGNGLRILDVSDPSRPEEVAAFPSPGHTFLHDVYVRDGLAFLSNWDAGLVILDVGHGVAGGSPEAPVQISRLQVSGGQTHNAWYWPESGYVFVGEEDFGTPGVMHVVDVRDLERPREVATFAVPNDPPHNFWLDEDDEILYLAWYGNGIRAVDVSGELLGELDRQGREVAFARYGDGSTCPAVGACTWAPQLHDGRLFLSDIGQGLVVASPAR